MIVKLKCVSNDRVKYITKGKVYNATKEPLYNFVYELLDDTGHKIAVSTDNDNNFHGKWEVVN